MVEVDMGDTGLFDNSFNGSRVACDLAAIAQ